MSSVKMMIVRVAFIWLIVQFVFVDALWISSRGRNSNSDVKDQRHYVILARKNVTCIPRNSPVKILLNNTGNAILLPECNSTAHGIKVVSAKQIQEKQDLYENPEFELSRDFEGQPKAGQYIYEYDTMHTPEYSNHQQYRPAAQPPRQEKYEQLPEPLYFKYQNDEQRPQLNEPQPQKVFLEHHRYNEAPQAQKLVEPPRPQPQRVVEQVQYQHRPQFESGDSFDDQQYLKLRAHPRPVPQAHLYPKPTQQAPQTPDNQYFISNRLPNHKFRLTNQPHYHEVHPTTEVQSEPESDFDTKPEHVHYHYSLPGEHKQVEEPYYEPPKNLNFSRIVQQASPTPFAPRFRIKKPIQIHKNVEERPQEYNQPQVSTIEKLNYNKQYTSMKNVPKKVVDSYGNPIRNYHQPQFVESFRQYDNESEDPSPKAVKIEIPRDEIYKHIETSVHKIIRELKEKKEKENFNKPPSNPSWSNHQIPQDHLKSLEKELKQGKVEQHRIRGPSFVATTMQPPEYNDTPVQEYATPEPYYSNPIASSQGQTGRSERQPARNLHQNPPLNNGNSNFQQFNRFSAQSTASVPTSEFESEKISEQQIPQRQHHPTPKPLVQSVDLTMKNRPSIDLNALDVGQTWNHDSHFDHNKALKNVQNFDHTNAFQNNKYEIPESQKNDNNLPNYGLSGPNEFQREQPSQQYRNPSPDTKYSFRDNSEFDSHKQNVIPTQSQEIAGEYKFKNEPKNYSQPPPPLPQAPVRIVSNGMPIIKEVSEGPNIFKVMVEPGKMPKELLNPTPSTYNYALQPEYYPQSIQYHPNAQHVIAMQTEQPKFEDDAFRAHRFRNLNSHQYNFMTEASSSDSIQYLPPPPLSSSRNPLPYDSYSPIYNDNDHDSFYSPGKVMLTSPESESFYLRNKRHREERKKVMKSVPRKAKKYKTIKPIPSTDLKPPPKFNKFSRKSIS